MNIDVTAADYRVRTLEQRMPFHFGNVAVTEGPHLFCQLAVAIDGDKQQGSSMGKLLPMWFYKDPEMSLAEGYKDMATVFRKAGELARTGSAASTAFEYWNDLRARLNDWGADTAHPSLLLSYGLSMVEQALIDAICRYEGVPFAHAVRTNLFGIEPGEIYPELAGREPAEFLPAEPRRSIAIRHTVGQSDPLTEADIGDDDRLDDGLPESLAEYVQVDGVRHFKIKLAADVETDRQRLTRIRQVLDSLDVPEYSFTVDANEGYDSAGAFKRQWETLLEDPAVSKFLDELLYVEQPLARDDAFTAETREVFTNWDGRPPIIIDESDDRVDSAGTALEYGYDGTSHKNCKGVFKGVVNACLLSHRRETDPERTYVLSAEDLTTLGPVELLQDLAVVATLGADHVERNGHHYYRGLSGFTSEIQEDILQSHGDLYRRHEDGFATLAIDDGKIDLDSVVDAPFGVEPEFDITRFESLESWIDGLDG